MCRGGEVYKNTVFAKHSHALIHKTIFSFSKTLPNQNYLKIQTIQRLEIIHVRTVSLLRKTLESASQGAKLILYRQLYGSM